MSHFTVAVFSKDGEKTLEQLLAPYQENNMDDCPKEYLAFNDVTEEHQKEYNEECQAMVQFADGTRCSRYSDEAPNGIKLWVPDPEDKSSFASRKFKLPEGAEEIQVLFKEVYPTFEQFMKEYHSEEPDEETGRYGYWENPNTKWDWYQTGGRWKGLLLIKADAEGTSGSPGLMGSRANDENSAPEGYKWVDSAKIKDICWEKMAEIARQGREKQWEEAPKEDGFKRNFFYGIKQGETKEQYVERFSVFETFAVITPDGEWHEKGKMGWWACVSDEKENWNDGYYNAFIKNADPELTIAIVDCHI